MKAKKSEVKMDPEGFNNMPNQEEAKAWLEKRMMDLNAYDIEGIDYWKNESDTLVIKVSGEIECLLAGQFARDMQADEFHFRKVGKEFFVRMWWD